MIKKYSVTIEIAFSTIVDYELDNLKRVDYELVNLNRVTFLNTRLLIVTTKNIPFSLFFDTFLFKKHTKRIDILMKHIVFFDMIFKSLPFVLPFAQVNLHFAQKIIDMFKTYKT